MADQVVDIPTTNKTTATGVANVLRGNLGTNTNPYYSPVLDTYSGAAAAYSVNKLRTAYSGSAIRVRRSSDNTQSDIGFVGNDLDTATLATFVGAGNGFIVKWYDQSGNGNDLVQNTTGNQPKIRSTGVTETVNSKPAILFDGSNDFLLLTSTISATVPWSSVQVNNRRIAAKMGFVMSNNGSASPPATVMHYTDNKPYIHASSSGFSGSADTSTAQTVWSGVRNSTAGYIWKNTNIVSLTSTVYATSGNFDRVGSRSSGGVFTDGHAQCFIFYSSDKTNEVSGISNGLNLYFSVY